jgi:TrmH family RNA methyltransferase
MTSIVDRFAAARRDPALAVLSGFHALKHAVRFEAAIVEAVAPDPDAVGRLAESLAPDVAGLIAETVTPIAADVFARLTADSPGAAVAVIGVRPVADVAAVAAAPGRVVFLERPNHLGNIGASIRVAAAAGAVAVITTGDRDPWHPTALRGSAGLHFALPVIRTDRLPELGRTVVALDPTGESLSSGMIPGSAVVAFGSERHGVSPALQADADRLVAIPMRPGVSSLNLATAVAVALYT